MICLVLGFAYLDPSLSRIQLRYTIPVYLATGFALESLMACLTTQFAGGGRTIASAVAFNATQITGTSEGTLDARIGTIRLVVTINVSTYDSRLIIGDTHPTSPQL